MAAKRKIKASDEPKSPILPVDLVLPDDEEPGSAVFQEPLLDEYEYSEFAIAQADLGSQEASFLIIHTAILDHVRLNNCYFKKPKVTDVRFSACDFSNSECTESKINRVELLNCKLIGFKSLDAEVSDASLNSCQAEMGQFSGSHFISTTFQSCNLKGSDFRFCDLTGVRFINCRLTDAEFTGSKLGGVDFRGSDLRGIRLNPADLKGAILSRQQAIDLADFFAELLQIDLQD